MVRFQCIYVSA